MAVGSKPCCERINNSSSKYSRSFCRERLIEGWLVNSNSEALRVFFTSTNTFNTLSKLRSSCLKRLLIITGLHHRNCLDIPKLYILISYNQLEYIRERLHTEFIETNMRNHYEENDVSDAIGVNCIWRNGRRQ
ncbi:hypothetical protein VCR15J2_20670 [Vibrio coralliirubri]|uniref:Uncharacterized protein n=1 Tax=Vibrio coralliirubri TaxID=1516159 RepID=A0AA87BZY1_9VIBR|nr:hypothetical protein VCR15J2_20670 [Vibrio coralliirubri]CDT75995.1 hypothetical protein VCR31J2_1310270 [Vibrio coralliirubri]